METLRVFIKTSHGVLHKNINGAAKCNSKLGGTLVALTATQFNNAGYNAHCRRCFLGKTTEPAQVWINKD